MHHPPALSLSANRSKNESLRRAALAECCRSQSIRFFGGRSSIEFGLTHFGRGIVETLNEECKERCRPTPNLLDWLAIEFRDSGQSLKQLHRRLVTSETYRQSSSTREVLDGESRQGRTDAPLRSMSRIAYFGGCPVRVWMLK